MQDYKSKDIYTRTTERGNLLFFFFLDYIYTISWYYK